jgi:hypothetical protein
MKVITDNGGVVFKGRTIATTDARKILRAIRLRKNACSSKLNKTSNRISLLERFIDENRGKDIDLQTWMESKGLDYKEFFTSMGYYTGMQLVVSDDPENTPLVYHRAMKYNPEAGYHVADRRIVQDVDHEIVTHSQLGMTYDPALALYFPTTVYDSNAYSAAEGSGDRAMDIMGGFTADDIGNLTAHDDDSQDMVITVKELFYEEYDGVEEEMDSVIQLEHDLLNNDQYSNAEGEGAKKLCMAKCKLVRRKDGRRANCEGKCEQARKDRADRQEARQDKRGTKKSCKEQLQAGEITREEYRDCKEGARKTKRETVKEAGGNAFSRIGKTFARIFPLTALARGGTVILAKGNAFGFSTRLAPALLPPQIANEKFRPEAITAAKEGWKKTIKTWGKLGGDPTLLGKAIVKGFNKKPMKVSKKSSADGSSGYHFEPHSNAAEPISGAAIATMVTAGLTVVGSLIGMLNKGGVDKNPYKSGQTPSSYQDALNSGDVNNIPTPDPEAPQIDPITGKWIDPETGREVDPLTGEFIDDKILGMNKWLAIGVGVTALGLIALAVRKATK